MKKKLKTSPLITNEFFQSFLKTSFCQISIITVKCTTSFQDTSTTARGKFISALTSSQAAPVPLRKQVWISSLSPPSPLAVSPVPRGVGEFYRRRQLQNRTVILRPRNDVLLAADIDVAFKNKQTNKQTSKRRPRSMHCRWPRVTLRLSRFSNRKLPADCTQYRIFRPPSFSLSKKQKFKSKD